MTLMHKMSFQRLSQYHKSGEFLHSPDSLFINTRPHWMRAGRAVLREEGDETHEQPEIPGG